MNNSFSLQQMSRTGNLDSNLISWQYKLHPMADFMRIKNENPKVKQSEIANRWSYSSSTLQRYRNDIYMLSPSRVQPNNTKKRTKNASFTNFDSDSHRESDVKRPLLNSNELKPTSKESSPEAKPVKSKDKLKGCANIKIWRKIFRWICAQRLPLNGPSYTNNC